MGIENCKFCNFTEVHILWSSFGVVLGLPYRPHVAPADGGHVIAIPQLHVADRRALQPRENLAVLLATCIGADALGEAFGAEWQNYQENGNWAVDSIAGPHMHVHVYGRRKASIMQPFGEPLLLPKSREDAYVQVDAPSREEIELLRSAVASRDTRRYASYEATIRLLEERS